MKHPEVENIKAAYEVADENGKKVISALYPELFSTIKAVDCPITERIKTFEDALNELGENHPLVSQYTFNFSENSGWEGKDSADFEAFLKLRIIAAALNEGWAPNWGNKNERKWYPYFYILSGKEYEDLDKEEKCRVVGRASSSAVANGGLVYANASYVSASSLTSYGSRLAFKTKELAEYCGKQFGELWAASHVG